VDNSCLFYGLGNYKIFFSWVTLPGGLHPLPPRGLRPHRKWGRSVLQQDVANLTEHPP
jgi:hypothetical protein